VAGRASSRRDGNLISPRQHPRRCPLSRSPRIPIPYRHPLVEDGGAILTAAFLLSWGLVLLREVGGVSGGLAGLAFVISYATGTPLGLVFFLINLPFYYFAVRRMGWAFTIKTFVLVLLASVFTSVIPSLIDIGSIQPLFACVFSGLSIGIGMLIIFRHGGSGGGFGVVAAYAQEALGWRAGYVQGALDLLVLLCALPLVEPLILVYSVAGTVVLNLVLAVNHRPGRYRP